MSSCRYLVINGVVSQASEVPQVSSFLETHPGAYTTTRTHNEGSYILFWERHMRRLAESARILAESRPNFLYGPEQSKSAKKVSFSSISSSWESLIRPLIDDSIREVLPMSLNGRSNGEELAITTLVSGNSKNVERDMDVYLHIGIYVPPVFGLKQNGAHLAVVGRGRDVAMAKYSHWVSIRKSLEKLRPPLANELLLSNDGDRILEGCLTNFFVVCRKEDGGTLDKCHSDIKSRCTFEVQTAPLGDGILPGVIRQLVIEVCSSSGIAFREVAPLWSQRELWQEAFITNSLRLVQHVGTIRMPSSWEMLELKTLKEVNWEEKSFEVGPGILTSKIQQAVMARAGPEGFRVRDMYD